MVSKNKFFYGYWIVLSGLVILTLNAGFGFFGFSVFNKPIADDFGWSRGEVTVAFSIFIITAAILSPIVGWLTDKRGPRQVLFLGTIVLSLALFLTPSFRDLEKHNHPHGYNRLYTILLLRSIESKRCHFLHNMMILQLGNLPQGG